MVKVLKNKIYLSSIIGIVISIISLITLFFVEGKSYFTVLFGVNVFINFLVVGLILLFNGKETPSLRFKIISAYLMVTLFMLLMDINIVSNFWDLDSYSNLMYLTNMKLYVGIYSLFVIIMVIMGLYVTIKNLQDKTKAVSTKADKTEKINSKKNEN